MWRGVVVALLLVTSAYASDGWQGRPHVCDMPSGPRLIQCQTWISTVKRPDYRGASCCGDGDAFVSDNFERGPNGELYAIITGDYSQDPVAVYLGIDNGSKILIPLEKRNYAPEDAGNTSGHGVIFLMPSNGEVLCYFAPPLT